MKGVQCYELFGGIALKNHTFSFFIFIYGLFINDRRKNDVSHNDDDDLSCLKCKIKLLP